MEGLSRNNQGYVVVKQNSTSGAWVAERTEGSTGNSHTHGLWTTKREAERDANRLNSGKGCSREICTECGRY